MDQQTLWIVAALSVGTLLGVFWRMRGGFGPMNLRAVGIVLVAALYPLSRESGVSGLCHGIWGANRTSGVGSAVGLDSNINPALTHD